MKRRTFALSAAAALGAACAPLAAGAQFLPGRFQQQLTIGVNVPLSGDGGDAGRQIAGGVQAAIDYANRFGGSFGSAFVMRTFDDMDALAKSMMNVQFAAADSTVIATVAGFDGALIAAALPTYANAQMPVLVPGSTADGITSRGYRNVWRLPTKDSVEGQLAAAFIAKRRKPKLAIAVTQDGDYGHNVAQGFLNQSKSAAMQSLLYLFPYDKPDYRAAAQAVVAKAPDFIYLCGTTSAMGPLIPALRAAGYAGTFGGSQGLYNEPLLTQYADALYDAVISTSLPPLDRAPDFANVLADFDSRYPVTALSSFAYAAAQIVIGAVRRTGAANRLSVMAALQGPASYTTLVGPFQFGPTGDTIDPIVYFYTVVENKFKFIAPSHATSFVL